MIGRVQTEIIGGFDLGNETVPETADGLCAFLDRKAHRCAIYEDRPQVCREYGQIPELPCPYVKANGNPRSPAKVRRMQRRIGHQVDDAMHRCTRIASGKYSPC